MSGRVHVCGASVVDGTGVPGGAPTSSSTAGRSWPSARRTGGIDQMTQGRGPFLRDLTETSAETGRPVTWARTQFDVILGNDDEVERVERRAGPRRVLGLSDAGGHAGACISTHLVSYSSGDRRADAGGGGVVPHRACRRGRVPGPRAGVTRPGTAAARVARVVERGRATAADPDLPAGADRPVADSLGISHTWASGVPHASTAPPSTAAPRPCC